MDGSKSNSIEPPYALIAELTHRCPLSCLYCSNPVELSRQATELTTQEWIRVIHQAARLGVLQLHLSGGEPALRHDLREICQAAHDADLYVNLITSGIGLTAARIASLKEAGLNAVQLSLQGADEITTEAVSGVNCLAYKREVAAQIISAELPLTLNIVLHRLNIDDLANIVEQCVQLRPHRIELANTQYYGWARENLATLLPSREQVEAGARVFECSKAANSNIEMIWVKSDYYENYPKACTGGWARQQLTISPEGRVLPCPAAYAIKTLQFDSIREKPVDQIWYHSSALNAFRGIAWMPQPCRSCERQGQDFAGCRCQAFILTGDATQTDPVCQLSPHRHLVDKQIAAACDTADISHQRLNRNYT